MEKRFIERNMFYGASKRIFLRASELRRNMTMPEKLLWEELKNKGSMNIRFKRQHPVDIFVLDFYCHKYKLAIEIDGEIHNNEDVRRYDDGRSHDIEKLGIRILRFTNKEVIENIDLVKKRIIQEITSFTPLQGGRGAVDKLPPTPECHLLDACISISSNQWIHGFTKRTFGPVPGVTSRSIPGGIE